MAEPRLDPPESDVVDDCAHCDENVYEGDEAYRLDDGDIVHIECWDEYSGAVLRRTLIIAGEG